MAGREPGASRPKQTRQSMILDLLATRGRLTVTEAAEALEVSDATIRRDFADLDARQLASRTHGGVVASAVAYELPYRYRVSHDDAVLERIGANAAGLVAPGDVVVFNGGTTTTATARALSARADLTSGPERVTIVTNALNIAAETVLRPHVQCVALGGVARPESYEVSGRLAELCIEQMWFDIGFFGVDGLSAVAGATCRLDDEASVVRMMVERSSRVVAVTSHHKLGKKALATMCAATDIDVLVTDADPADPSVQELRALGLDVRLVDGVTADRNGDVR